ncbi:MAG: Uma2 family endonuclease [Limisphaerales bacterium]|jgi:Uma2 family endonuclease
MVVARNEIDFRHAHPNTAALVVEVSINTLDRDREKAAIYAAAGVKEYWLVTPGAESITVYRNPIESRYQEEFQHSIAATATSGAIEGFSIRLSEFFG